MSLAKFGRFSLIVGLPIIGSLVVISILAPTRSPSRRKAEYGLRALPQHPQPPLEPGPGQSLPIPASSDNVKTAVIFVHGLGADPTRTWCEGQTCWITDLLPDDIKEEGLGPFVHLFAFDYDSFWVREANSTNLVQTARDLAYELKQRELSHYNLVFVAHSYGGLVVKKALVLNPDLKHRVKGILFLGTPHRGTRFARFGAALTWLLSPFDADADIMRPLSYDNLDLDDLEKEFHASFGLTERRYFFETHKMRYYLFGFIPYLREFMVERQSATSGASANQVISLNADHRGLNRFSFRNSNYSKLVRELLQVLNQAVHGVDDGRSASNWDMIHNSRGHWLVPFSRNVNFVGRTGVLEELKDRFRFDHKSVPVHSRVALHGLGGIGKTQIAIAYIHWLQMAHPDVSVFWVHASTAERMRQAFAAIAQLCDIPGSDDSAADVLLLVKEWLENESVGRWLLAIDNADDADFFFPPRQGSDLPPEDTNLARYLPDVAHGSILITTRNKKAGIRLTKGQQPIEISKMEDDESRQLIRTSLNDPNISEDTIMALSSRLEHLPLALVQAASFIRENTISVERYFDLLQKSDQNLAKLLSQPFETIGRDSDTPDAVATTWIVSFEQIRKQDLLASDLLSIMALFDRSAIPRSFVYEYYRERNNAHYWDDSDGDDGDSNGSDHPTGSDASNDDSEDIEFINSMGTLKAFSFISEQEDDSYSMHRLVQLVTQKWLTSQKTKARFASRALEVVSDSFPYGKHENREICGRYLPHAYAVLANCPPGRAEGATATLLHCMAAFCEYRGQWSETRKLLERGLEIRRRTLGEEHHYTLASMHNLAQNYQDTGRWAEAESMLRQVMETEERTLGMDHPDTLISTYNLARSFQISGRHRESEQLQLRVLAARKRVLGEHHLDTIIGKHNLAWLYQETGRYKEAEELLLEVLEAKNELLGEGHPETITSNDTLAIVYLEQGRLDEAERLMLKVVENNSKLYSKEHPDLLLSLNNLGSIYAKQGRLKEAEELQQRVLDTRTRTIGLDHHETLTTMNNLAANFNLQGRKEEAIELMRKCLSLREKLLGPNHPYTQDSRIDLGNWEGHQWTDSESSATDYEHGSTDDEGSELGEPSLARENSDNQDAPNDERRLGDEEPLSAREDSDNVEGSDGEERAGGIIRGGEGEEGGREREHSSQLTDDEEGAEHEEGSKARVRPDNGDSRDDEERSELLKNEEEVQVQEGYDEGERPNEGETVDDVDRLNDGREAEDDHVTPRDEIRDDDERSDVGAHAPFFPTKGAEEAGVKARRDRDEV
ncbi:hypothetical protein B0T10DRAFT_81257 [Thelonectria olida]|uniref:AB hydrolase-1 domain-containing protein n=1 Tax=Thelonectria olida TaxID=1576542 RepID=A0A9P8W1I4_9HYPO|nr:hypothetical protein B0T10DRAFT_81257 [Thelonectria olida]